MTTALFVCWFTVWSANINKFIHTVLLDIDEIRRAAEPAVLRRLRGRDRNDADRRRSGVATVRRARGASTSPSADQRAQPFRLRQSDAERHSERALPRSTLRPGALRPRRAADCSAADGSTRR